MKAKPIPEDYQPSEKLMAWATEKHPFVDHDLETEKFVDHFLATGKCYANWDAAWRNWIRRSKEYNPDYRSGPSQMGRYTRTNAAKVSQALGEHNTPHDAGGNGKVVQLRRLGNG